jgi:hypothetical protein
MRILRPHSRASVLASALAAGGIVLAVAGCSQITPLGPEPMQLPPPRQLGSPIIVQVMRLQPPAATGGCPAGWVAVSLPAGGGPQVSTAGAAPVGPPEPVPTAVSASPPAASAPAASSAPSLSSASAANIDCYRPIGRPVTITTAAVSSLLTFTPPPGQANEPDLYGFIVGVPDADVPAVTAVISRSYATASRVGISVDGKLWQALMTFKPFPGRHLEISLLSKKQALYLYRLLVPSG